MPENNKKDMSTTCGFAYDKLWYKANITHEVTQDEWKKWYNEHCRKCCFMGEVCMHEKK